MEIAKHPWKRISKINGSFWVLFCIAFEKKYFFQKAFFIRRYVLTFFFEIHNLEKKMIKNKRSWKLNDSIGV